jgi:Uncharacterized protein conserved in bacteria (DUF2252)
MGTRCWVILLLGREHSDALFLQAKEAPRYSLERFAGRSGFSNQGQRVVEGQRLRPLATSFLGWLGEPPGIEDLKLHDLYRHQQWDSRTSVDIAAPSEMPLHAGFCASALARAHARSGDSIAIASLGSSEVLDRAIARPRRHSDRRTSGEVRANDCCRLSRVRGGRTDAP